MSDFKRFVILMKTREPVEFASVGHDCMNRIPYNIDCSFRVTVRDGKMIFSEPEVICYENSEPYTKVVSSDGKDIVTTLSYSLGIETERFKEKTETIIRDGCVGLALDGSEDTAFLRTLNLLFCTALNTWALDHLYLFEDGDFAKTLTQAWRGDLTNITASNLTIGAISKMVNVSTALIDCDSRKTLVDYWSAQCPVFEVEVGFNAKNK